MMCQISGREAAEAHGVGDGKGIIPYLTEIFVGDRNLGL